MSIPRAREVGTSEAGGATADQLFSYGLHATALDEQGGVAEQKEGLSHLFRECGRDDANLWEGSKAPGSKDGVYGDTAYVGPDVELSRAYSFYSASRRDIERREEMGKVQVRQKVLVPGESDVAGDERKVH